MIGFYLFSVIPPIVLVVVGCFLICWGEAGLNGERSCREIRLYQPSEKQPRTKDDDDEDDWGDDAE
jgi:hypothetical protein